MQRYVDRLVKLNVNFDEELAVDIVLNSLPSCYDQFILTYHMNNSETSLSQLHNLLRTAEAGMKGKSIPSTPAVSAEERTPSCELEGQDACQAWLRVCTYPCAQRGYLLLLQREGALEEKLPEIPARSQRRQS